MTELPERLNIADWLLDARVREGRGDRPALLTDQGTFTYRDVQVLANRFGHMLESAGVAPEQRVIIALPDGPEFVAALFGTLKVGAVVVMVNPQLAVDAIEYFYSYTRATVALVHRYTAPAFQAAQRASGHLKQIIIVGEPVTTRAVEGASPELETFPSHRDDAAIWLFSGGTTGKPKAVVQSYHAGSAEALLWVRDRLESVFSVLGRRSDGAVSRQEHGGNALREDSEVPANRARERADNGESDGSPPGLCSAGPI